MSISTDITRIENAKVAIKTAIEGKGVTVPDATLLDGMASLIESIESGVSGVWCGSITPVSLSNHYNLVVSPAVNDDLYNAVKGNRVIGIAMETGNTEDTTNRCLGGGGITNANNREIDIGVYYYNKYYPYSNNTSRTFSPNASSTLGVYFGGGNSSFRYMNGKTYIWVIAKIDVGVTG